MTDADRRRRLALATARAPGRPRPTAAQLEAVSEAWRRVAACFGELLPNRIALRWQSATYQEPGFNPHSNGCVGFHPSGAVILCLRTDRSPQAILRTATHELVHMVHYVSDPAATRLDMESAAEAATARLVPEVQRDAN